MASLPPSHPGPLRCVLTGACGGYGRTLLGRVRHIEDITACVLVDPDLTGTAAMLDDLGLAGTYSVPTDLAAAADAVDAGSTVLVPNADLVPWDAVDVLIEASGKIGPGCAYAATAIDTSTAVVMVSKEVDTVAGPALFERARAAGVAYLPGDGDQPANLLRLLAWIESLGLDVVALGKAGEYDLELAPEQGVITHAGRTVPVADVPDLLQFDPDDVAGTIARRATDVADLTRSAAADLCEMTVVAQRTDAVADVETLHYPVARPAELADVYAPREHGGLLSHRPAIDVVSALRLPGEASMAGGVFVVVATDDDVTWEMLRGKGHIIGRDGRHACIWWPYHLMGVETPATIRAALAGPSGAAPRHRVLLAGRTDRALSAGTELRVAGHHHEIDGVAPVIVPPQDALAFYLLDGARLVADVPAGHLLTEADVTGLSPVARALHAEGRALPL